MEKLRINISRISSLTYLFIWFLMFWLFLWCACAEMAALAIELRGSSLPPTFCISPPPSFCSTSSRIFHYRDTLFQRVTWKDAPCVLYRCLSGHQCYNYGERAGRIAQKTTESAYETAVFTQRLDYNVSASSSSRRTSADFGAAVNTNRCQACMAREWPVMGN